MWNPLGFETECQNGASSASMMRDPWRAGIVRVVAQRDDATARK